MAPCTSVFCTFDSTDSSNKDQLLMEPNSEDPKDNNDQEAEVAPVEKAYSIPPTRPIHIQETPVYASSLHS